MDRVVVLLRLRQPTLTDDRSGAKDVALFYEEFEDVCALANNCNIVNSF